MLKQDPTPFEKDLLKLKEAMPGDEEELCDALGISMVSPEGYYATLVYQWMDEQCREAST